MSRSGLIQKEKKREKLIKKFFIKKRKFKKIINNPKTSPLDRYNAQKKIQKIPKNSSIIRRRNRCLITGRPRGVFRRFGISRSVIRNLAFSGKIPGIYKACW